MRAIADNELNIKHMYIRLYIFLLLAIATASCSGGSQFSRYQREYVGKAEIGGNVTKTIVLQNTSLDKVQHITGLNFDAGANREGHFRIEKVEVGGVAQNPKTKDITVPAGSILEISVTYQPLNLDTTVESYGGWQTGYEERYVPQPPKKDAGDEDAAVSAVDAMSQMISEELPAIHRAIVAVVYDYPRMGIVQLEVIGEAVPGPSGEVTAAGAFAGECSEAAGTLCYKGGFAIELPDIMSGGPKQLKMTGPAEFKISGSSVNIDMTTFPAVLLVLKGNGPGEPLEGKPINAISIVISGTEGAEAAGTFDGSRLELNGVAFRIRVILGEITDADINPGLQAAVDFNIKDLTLSTIKPATNGSIMLEVTTTLLQEPSGNPMFDQFLGGTQVNVVMDGTISLY